MRRGRLLGLFSTVVAVAVLAAVFHPPALPWDQKLDFGLAANASFGELNKDAEVDLNGLKIGKVVGLQPRGGQSVVSVEVERRYAGQLHEDATAVIRPHGLLGPKYVDLSGGSQGRLRNGAVIPASRVHVTTDVDQVLNALQPDVRQSLQTLLVELSKGSDGRGTDMNATLKALGGSTSDVSTVSGTLHSRDQDLAQIFADSELFNRDLQHAPIDQQIQDTNRVLSGLAQVEGSMGSGIDHTAHVLADLDLVMDGNSQNLAAVLSRSPGAVTRLETVVTLGDQIVTAVNPSLPYLMTAVVYTKSAFGGSDANGHYVRVMSVNGPCTLGISMQCAATPSGSGSGSRGARPGSASAGAGAASAVPAPGSRATDQDLMRMLLGGS